MAKALAGFYLLLILGLLATAVGIWRLQCESFGCMGVGVAWFAWIVAFFVVLGIGVIARIKAAPVVGLARVCRATWWLQLAGGAVLLIIWFSKRAA
jgi:FtsH-binding integral membrane protein